MSAFGCASLRGYSIGVAGERIEGYSQTDPDQTVGRLVLLAKDVQNWVLAGLIGMTAAIRYRYYISSVLAEGRKEEAGSVCRVPAAEIEALVIGGIRSHVNSCPIDVTDRAVLECYCEKVVIKQGSVELLLKHATDNKLPSISLPWVPQPLKRKREIIFPSTKSDRPTRPIRAETRARLIEGIAKGRLWLNELVSGTFASTQKIATRERCSERSVRMTLSLAFLSPALVKSAIEGTLPYGVGITQFIEPALNWNDQLARLR